MNTLFILIGKKVLKLLNPNKQDSRSDKFQIMIQDSTLMCYHPICENEATHAIVGISTYYVDIRCDEHEVGKMKSEFRRISFEELIAYTILYS